MALVLTACGPRTGGLPSEGGSDDSAGDSESGGDTTTIDAVNDTGDSTSSDTADSTGESLVNWCLRGSNQTELHLGQALQAVSDSDGNGRDEVWMTEWTEDRGAETHTSRIQAFELGPDGLLAMVADVERAGVPLTMVDIDGDGLLDLLMDDWDAPQAWWYVGLPGLSIDEVSQPLVRPGEWGSWLDGNGDGLVDFFERTDAGLSLHLGDGMGGFTFADTHAYPRKRTSQKLWPTEVPGVLLASYAPGFKAFTDDFHALSVSPVGAITVLASGKTAAVSVQHVRDFDGDGVPDVLGFDELSNESMTYLHQGSPGQYVAQSIEEPVRGMAADTLTSAGEVEVLHWTSVEGEMWLRPPQDGGWPNAIEVTVEGPWFHSGAITPLQADGEGGRELLLLSAQGDSSRYSLWRLEPCEA